MNTKAALLCVLCSAAVLHGSAAEKKSSTRKHSGTYETSNGNSGTVEGTTNREGDRTERTDSVTNQDGKTVTRDAVRTTDREDETSELTATTTGPGGKTATVNSTSRQNADGTISTAGERTGFNGKTATLSGTTTKTGDGRTTKGSVTGPNGKTATTESTVKHEDGQTTKTQLITSEGGKTAGRVVMSKKNPDGSTTRVIETTAPDGTKHTRTETVKLDSPAK